MLIKVLCLCKRVGRDRGAGARENRGQKGTGDGRRKGGKRDLYDGGKRERNSKEASFRYLLLLIIQSKKRTQQRSWLPFNVLRGLKQNFVWKKSQKTKFVLGIKKKKQHYFRWNWKPFQVAYIIGHEWDGMTHVNVCRRCQSCQCLNCLAKGRESGEKGTKRYRRRENGVREGGGCDLPVPPPSPPLLISLNK